MKHRLTRPRWLPATRSEGWALALIVASTVFSCDVDDEPEPTTYTGSAGATEGGAPNAGTAGAHAGDGGAPEAEAACGDGVRSGTEACDDGNGELGDGCDPECRIEAVEGACGDGALADEESCDDGNLQPGDGCDELCRSERCGNARVDAGEECDPPRAGACTSSCITLGKDCGDRRVQAAEGEQCDDGNDTPGDGCHDCRVECGDGRIDAEIGEECEPEYSDRCSDGCEWLPSCGDGEVQPAAGEECDPSNGLTCVQCQVTEPPTPCNGGAGGGAGALGHGGDCGLPPRCVPSGAAGVELVQNGRFDTGSTGWETQTPLVELRSVGEGSPEPQALEVTFAEGPVRAISGASQCIPVRPGASYELTAKYHIASGVPAGVAANVTAFLFSGTQCTGAFGIPPMTGPAGSVREAWTPYQLVVDTSGLRVDTPARLLLRLNVVRPAGVAGSRVLWDSVSLQERGSACGNCSVDAREDCDDGNTTSGDGCTASCLLENCGDGTREATEQCDDGNTTFGDPGDRCLPNCNSASACDDCALTSCAEELDACLALDGAANAGPAAGTPRSTLCARLRDCVQTSACDQVERKTSGTDGAFLENCYCGSAASDCFETPSAANGSCRAEVEAALETRAPLTILQRFGNADPAYSVFSSLRTLRACERPSCAASCAPSPSCGDGRVQDRNFTLPLIVDGQDVACRDELTHTGRGCAFEECDDGNTATGDGCDQHCFAEACGNYLIQSGEECDDGNTTSRDGCDSECQAEYDCGDGVREEPFEECDPPDPEGGRVCSEAEYASNPAQCGCGALCRRTVCGDGVVQRPAEQCDPPNAISCGDDCRRLDQGPCETCIAGNPDLESLNSECNDNPVCVAIKQCVLENHDCFLPLAAACYCGDDVETCESPDFIPVGPCVEEIRAGFGGDSISNPDVLELYYNVEFLTGVAMNIVDEASRVCTAECFP